MTRPVHYVTIFSFTRPDNAWHSPVIEVSYCAELDRYSLGHLKRVEGGFQLWHAESSQSLPDILRAMADLIETPEAYFAMQQEKAARDDAGLGDEE